MAPSPVSSTTCFRSSLIPVGIWSSTLVDYSFIVVVTRKRSAFDLIQHYLLPTSTLRAVLRLDTIKVLPFFCGNRLCLVTAKELGCIGRWKRGSGTKTAKPIAGRSGCWYLPPFSWADPDFNCDKALVHAEHRSSFPDFGTYRCVNYCVVRSPSCVCFLFR